jgi:hypothetical protein
LLSCNCPHGHNFKYSLKDEVSISNLLVNKFPYLTNEISWLLYDLVPQKVIKT